MYTTFGTYYCLWMTCMLSWFDCSNPTRTKHSHLKRIISTNCYIQGDTKKLVQNFIVLVYVCRNLLTEL